MKTTWKLVICSIVLALVLAYMPTLIAETMLRGHDRAVTAVGFSPDGVMLVSGDESGVLNIWDLPENRAVKSIRAHRGRINDLEVSPNGKAIASAGNDNAVKVWSMSTFTPRYSFVPPQRQKSFVDDMLDQMRAEAYAVCFSNNTRYLASGHGDFRSFVWNLTDSSFKKLSGEGKKLDDTDNKTPEAPVLSVALSPDGRLAAAGEKQDSYKDVLGKTSTWAYIYVWNPHTRDVIKRFDAGSSVLYLAFLPDNKHLLSVLLNGKIIVWDAVRGESVKAFDHGAEVRSARISYSGERLVTCSRDTVKVWDVNTGSVKSYKGPMDADFTAAAPSAEGNRVAIGHEGGIITLIESEQLQAEVLFDNDEQPVAPAPPEQGEKPGQPINNQPPKEKLWD